MENNISNLEWLKNKKIAILGFWREGKSTLKFLQKINCHNIIIHDKNIISCHYWESKSGDLYLEWLEQYDVIFISPGISRYLPEIQKVNEKIITQTQLFFNNYSWKVISLTGTKWKSTTCQIIYKTLKKAWYKTKLVWNIWNPVLDEIDILNWEKHDYVVYELSSYMLEWLEKNDFISVLLNIYPDHLDWHNWIENYKNAKLNILHGSEYNLVWYTKWILESYENSFGENWKYKYVNGTFFVSEKEIFSNIKTSLLGEHNKYNVCAVLWVCDIIWISYEVLKNTLKTFNPLPHRLENIWIFNDITFIDDAISTTPESTIAAIKTFWSEIDTIFLWGTDRWYDYWKLVNILKKYSILQIVLFPESGEKIEKLLDNNFITLKAENMWEAVKFAFKNTKKWKICLLSTAAPSYSLWKNFEEKWELYKKTIIEYENV